MHFKSLVFFIKDICKSSVYIVNSDREIRNNILTSLNKHLFLCTKYSYIVFKSAYLLQIIFVYIDANSVFGFSPNIPFTRIPTDLLEEKMQPN